MSGAKVTPIKLQAAARLSAEVTEQIEAARDLAFDAQAIATVAAAAVISEMTLGKLCTAAYASKI